MNSDLQQRIRERIQQQKKTLNVATDKRAEIKKYFGQLEKPEKTRLIKELLDMIQKGNLFNNPLDGLITQTTKQNVVKGQYEVVKMGFDSKRLDNNIELFEQQAVQMAKRLNSEYINYVLLSQQVMTYHDKLFQEIVKTITNETQKIIGQQAGESVTVEQASEKIAKSMEGFSEQMKKVVGSFNTQKK